MAIKVGDMVDGQSSLGSYKGDAKWPQQARVIAIAEGYAMVRFKGCMPFIVPTKDLERWNPDVKTEKHQ